MFGRSCAKRAALAVHIRFCERFLIALKITLGCALVALFYWAYRSRMFTLTRRVRTFWVAAAAYALLVCTL